MHFNNLDTGMIVERSRLSELCTEGQVLVRVLGTHDEALCDCRATTVFLNGNNIQVAGDLVLRTLECRLDPPEAEPETRVFKFDPIAEIRKDRGGYLAAAFIIAKAYMNAGCPEQEKAHLVSGFGDWSRLVQQSLMWLGMDDPWGNINRMRAMDPILQEHNKLISVLRNNFKNGDIFTVATCELKAQNNQDLRELMGFDDGKVNSRKFGHLLRKYKGKKTKDGWQYQFVTDSSGAAAYKLLAPEMPM